MGDGWVVEYSLPTRCISALMSVEAVGVIYLLISVVGERPVAASVGIVMLGAVTIVMNLEFFWVRVYYDDDGIEARSRWGMAENSVESDEGTEVSANA